MNNNISLSEKILVIVESSAKRKTVEYILKQTGYSNVTVMASLGNIMTLGNGGPIYNSGIYLHNQFKMNLAIEEDKKKIVHDIAKQAELSEKIFILTNRGVDGELLAWSLINFCKIQKEKCFRLTTNEITAEAIIAALKNPAVLDSNLVDAGLAKMAVDKLIGYGLSPLCKKYLGIKSIGRYQAIGLKLLSDREKEINEAIPELQFGLYLNFIKNSNNFQAKYSGYKQEVINNFTRQADIDAIINDCKNNNYVIENITKCTRKEAPEKPFCTATFQQEACKLGITAKDAMTAAQKLFDGIKINNEYKGLITSVKTDVTSMSIKFIETLNHFINNTYNESYQIKPQSSQLNPTDEEAIRITDPTITPEILASNTSNDLLIKVYKLIWQRTIASVLPSAVIEDTVYTISNNSHKFTFNSEKLINPGYKIVYINENNDILIDTEVLTTGDFLESTDLKIIKKLIYPIERYTEASLIEKLHKKAICKPGMLVSIIEATLSQTRGYAEVEDNFISLTNRGMQLASYCDRAFAAIINLNYFKELEQSFDKIATGAITLIDFIENFCRYLQNIIETNYEMGIITEMPDKMCPICGSTMVVRRSKFGKLFYGCSNYPMCTGIISID